MTHTAEILARVQRMYPHDTKRQRLALARWARVIRANDPRVAALLLELRFVGNSNESGRKVPA